MLVVGCVSCQPGFLRLNTKSIRIPETRIFHQFCIILNKQLPEPSYSITMIHEIQMLYLHVLVGFTEPLPGANFQRNEWFSKSCLVANIPPMDDNKSYFSNMYENHFLTNFSLTSVCLCLLPLCWRPRSCFMTAVLAECWMLNFPFLLCSKRSSTSNWASGYSARREDIGKVVFIQYAIWKKQTLYPEIQGCFPRGPIQSSEFYFTSMRIICKLVCWWWFQHLF